MMMMPIHLVLALSTGTQEEVLSEVGRVLPQLILFDGGFLLCGAKFAFLVDDELLEYLSHGWTKLQCRIPSKKAHF